MAFGILARTTMSAVIPIVIEWRHRLFRNDRDRFGKQFGIAGRYKHSCPPVVQHLRTLPDCRRDHRQSSHPVFDYRQGQAFAGGA